ncbi:MAG: hypothetical protein ACRDTA_24085 [Pseudonocardiaceae bacterium]
MQGDGPSLAIAERVERESIDLDILGSKDRIAALHFDLARSWAQAGRTAAGSGLRPADLSV